MAMMVGPPLLGGGVVDPPISITEDWAGCGQVRQAKKNNRRERFFFMVNVLYRVNDLQIVTSNLLYI